MHNPNDSVDRALAELRETGIPAHAWAYLAAEAVRGLNHATLTPGAYAYPGDVCSVAGELLALAQRLPQALHQASAALEVLDDAGHVRDVTDPGQTFTTVGQVTAGLQDAAGARTSLGERLSFAHNAAARLAHTDTTNNGTTSDDGAGAGER